jgi:hypothetical protein
VDGHGEASGFTIYNASPKDRPMFATRDSRRNAKVFVYLLAAALATGQAVEAVAQSNGGWAPRGSGGSPSSPSTSTPSANPWRLPNGQVMPAESNGKNAANSNTLRSGQPANNTLREPRAVNAPVNAQPIAAAPASPSATRSINVQQHTPSSAVTQTAAVVPARRPANTTMRPTQQPNFGTPRVARTMPPRNSVSSPSTARMWQRMNVAMNGAEWTGESEDLPLPGPTPAPSAKSMDNSDPFGSDPDGYYLQGDGGFHSSGHGSCECGDGCCGNCGCGEQCGCGDACEPGCGCSGCDDPACNDCLAVGPGDPESCHSIRLRVPKWQELAVFAGVQGFKGPYDQDRDASNFGFHEGFNAGYKIPYTYMGYQIGYQAAQSDLNGDEDLPSGHSHTQHFTTLGLYRRCQDGLQFGSAWDVLADRRHHARTFHQIRNELSWIDCGIHEIGVSATVGIMDHEDQDDEDITWEATDQYLLFYRIHGKTCGEGRIYGGWTDDSDGILGADMLLPVHDRWSVQTGFTYMIPDARDGVDGAQEEAWNINLALVWHWDCRARKSHDNPYRPLFNVANNGYMIIDSREN